MVKQGKVAKAERMLKREVKDKHLSLDTRHEDLYGYSLQSLQGTSITGKADSGGPCKPG